MPEQGVFVPNDLKVGDRLFYPPKGNLLMRIIEINVPTEFYGDFHSVKLVDIEEFERNNKQWTKDMNFVNVDMEDAVTFVKRCETEDIYDSVTSN